MSNNRITILEKGPNKLTYLISTAFHIITSGYTELGKDGPTTIYGKKHARRAITPVDKVPDDKRRKGKFEVMDYFI
jgi:hypothetical protein